MNSGRYYLNRLLGLKSVLYERRHIIIGCGTGIAMIMHHRAQQQPPHGVNSNEDRFELVHAEMERNENMEDFTKMMRFGMVDMSILMMSLVAGVSLDGVIARFIGVQGYGAIVGAGLGNCVADVIAGLPDGLYSSLGVGVGTLLPLVPLVIPMALKRPFSSGISQAFGASSLGFCVLAFVWGWQHHHVQESSSVLAMDQVTVLVQSQRYDDAIVVLQELKKNSKNAT